MISSVCPRTDRSRRYYGPDFHEIDQGNGRLNQPVSRHGVLKPMSKRPPWLRDLADRAGDSITVAWANGSYALTRYQLGQWRRATPSSPRPPGAPAASSSATAAPPWFARPKRG